MAREKLELLALDAYRGRGRDDPLRFYYLPVIGALYRRRVELCLEECRGGGAVLEVGFGSGLTFLNLHRKYRSIHGLDLESDPDAVAATFNGHGIETDLRNGSVLEMPWDDATFDTVLLISILEHLRPEELPVAFREIRRVLVPGGQVVYGVPIERPLMVVMFRLLGYDIRQHHFSTEVQVAAAAATLLREVRRRRLPAFQLPVVGNLLGDVYEVGHWVKEGGEGDAGD